MTPGLQDEHTPASPPPPPPQADLPPSPSDPTGAGATSRRRPVFRFVLVFGLCVGLFYLLSATHFFRQRFFPWYLGLNARTSAVILSAFGQGTRAYGNSVASQRFSVQVERGCDAVEPTVLFLAAVIASPVAFRAKVPGLILGTLVLALVNLSRIITLFLTGIYWPAAFHVMHVDIWQAIFIFLAILFWVIWALWALSRKGTKLYVAT